MANTIKVKRMRPATVVLGLVLFAVAAAVLFQLVPRGNVDKTDAVRYEPAIGNLQANISNGGLVLCVGTDVYVSDPTNDYQVSKTKLGETQGEEVVGIKGTFLNSDGQSLFYVDASTNFLMRSDLSGSGARPLVENSVTQVLLADDCLYYVDRDDGNMLKRIQKSGDEPAVLVSAARMFQYVIASDTILFQDMNDSGVTYSMNLDGTNLKTIPIDFGGCAFTAGSRFFYIDSAADGAVSYVTLSSDGSMYGPNPIETDVVSGMAADSTNVYYISAVDGCLYRQDIAMAEDAVRMTSTPVFKLQVVDEYVYYCDLLDGNALCCMEKSASVQ